MDLTGQKRKRVLPVSGSDPSSTLMTVSQSEPQFSFSSSGGANMDDATSRSSPSIRIAAADAGGGSSSSSTSSSTNSTNSKATRKLSSLLDKPAAKVPAISPAQYLKEAFQEWDVTIQPTRDQSNFLQATPERISAYDRDLLMVIRKQDIGELETLLEQGKLQHNACNAFGESLLHLACRKGMTQVVQFLVGTAKLSCWVHDDYGRTIWHDACWTVRPQWELVQFLLEQAPQLLTMSDVRGHIPLDYVPKSDWGVWLEFLKERREQLKDLLQAPNKKKDEEDTTAMVTSKAVRATIAAQESAHQLQALESIQEEGKESSTPMTTADAISQGPASAALLSEQDSSDQIVG
ncbi:MAG: hypothetical protein SGARI_004539 [Bacillariaceae sp.]